MVITLFLTPTLFLISVPYSDNQELPLLAFCSVKPSMRILAHTSKNLQQKSCPAIHLAVIFQT